MRTRATGAPQWRLPTVPITPRDIRNIALAGHPGAGKTTLFEALLHAGGLIQTAGSIERGNTVGDFDAEEIARGHSIQSSLASIEQAGLRINLIDTPGYADFRGPTLAALTAVETVAIVVNAPAGIEYGTRRMMHYARERGLARMLVVNRMDAEGTDLPSLVESLRAEFGPECLPVNLPERGRQRVLDAFFHQEGETDFDSLGQAHARILDQVVEINERMMGRYLDEGEQALSAQELHDAFEQCLREGHLVPIVFLSARSGAGVPEFIEVARRLLPNPGESNPPPYRRASDGVPIDVSPDPARHVLADVFKIQHDAFLGKIAVFRVHQGTVRRDAQLFIDDARKPFKVGHLFRLRGKDTVEITEAIPGDIVAVAKVDEIHPDAVLHDSHDEDGIRLDPIALPQPMFALAIEAASKGQEQKLALALSRLAEEDPCFRIEHHKELNETVVRGLGELHLKVTLARMRARFGVEVTQRAPRIAYRETVGRVAEGHHRHKKQTGGAGQFGEVYLRIEPLPRGAGFEFVDAVKGGTIPGQFMPAVEKGVRQGLGRGAVAGYPIEDVRVTIVDGKSHPVDSKEVAFVSAGRRAFLDAVLKADPLLLEPIVDLEVNVPEAHVGDLTGALASRRARILGTDSPRAGEGLIRAQAPLAELDGFATELKATTAGQGRYTMELAHYEATPPVVQKRLAAAWKPGAEED